jgi:RNA polymerase sigma-70 factor (ECF subfamily)
MIEEPREIRAWLEGARRGEPEALAALLDYYRPRLQKMVQFRMDARAGARVDQSDVLQEVYLDAASRLQDYLQEPKTTFYIWLRGLAWDRLLKLQRRHLGAECRAAGREMRLPLESSVVLFRQLLAERTTASQALLREEVRQQVRRALARLSAEDREVILMRHFEGLSNAEVAQAPGLSESGATRRHGRAVLRLKEILLAEASDQEVRP